MAWIFPGMDPFVEANGPWEDFHAKVISEIERALAPLLPRRYALRVAERSYFVLSPDSRGHIMLPDVAVVDRPAKRQHARTGSTAVAELPAPENPKRMRAQLETEFRETYLEIRELKRHHRLVTSIEVLSPSNKRPKTPGRKKYLRKRQAILEGGANLVEIDLLRGGTRMPMVDDWPDSPYYLLVARREQAPVCEVWQAHFRMPLPKVPVPLRHPDPDVSLDLQPLVEAVYQRSHYFDDIDYQKSLSPPLAAADAAWVKKQLRSHKT